MRRLLSFVVPATTVVLLAPTVSAAPWNQVDQSVFDDPVPVWSRDVELVDIDGDGWVDILFANVGGVFEGSEDSVFANQAYRNNGGVGFTDVSADVFVHPDAPEPPVEDTAHVIKACDIDNDGDQDLILGTTWATQSQLLLNDGGGMFTNATDTHFPVMPASVGDLECGDIDGDGDLDLVLTDWGPAPVAQVNSAGGQTMLWLNQGADMNYTFSPSPFPDFAVNYSLDLDFVDVDNDYDLDVVMACKSCLAAGTFLWENNGDGTFAAGNGGVAFDKKGNIELEAMDINSDGYLDLVTLGDGEGGGMEGFRNRILINDQLGGYVDDTISYWPLLENPGSGDRSAGFFDFGSDATPDIALVTNNSMLWPDRLMVWTDSVYMQNTAPFGGVITEGSQSLELADLTGDDRMDIVLAAGENAFENAVFFGDEMDMAPDTTVPSITNLEEPAAMYPGTLTVRARVHDWKTPNKPHDWEAVYLEWMEGVVDADELEANGTQETSFFYGGHMFSSAFDLPNALFITYRQCAIDIAGNKHCSDVVTVEVEGATTGESETETETDSNTNTNTDTDTVTDSATLTESQTDTMATDSDSNTDSSASQTASASETETESESASASDSETNSGGLDDDGCDCRTTKPDGGWSALALLALLGFRRRRDRH